LTATTSDRAAKAAAQKEALRQFRQDLFLSVIGV